MSKKGLPFLRRMQNRFHLSSFQTILAGFAGVILLGALLLMLPAASRAREVTPFLDALFTSTSATCVTGLVVYDTWTHWSLFGQAVILVLIQIGGLGVVTMAVALAVLSGKRVSLMQRSVMQDSISSGHVGGMVRLTRFIVRASVAMELAGAAVLFPVFARDFGFRKGLWYAVFHAVSAFCNAGFDLLGSRGQFSSLTGYVKNPVVNITVMALITVGGIGFLVWEDLVRNRMRLTHCRLQTKVVLAASLFLDLVPAALFYFCEYRGISGGTRILAALFQSVTCRTAGFNTTDLTRFSDSGIFLMIFLMLIGGSPGSTAGGMKTTTAALLFASAISVFRRRDDTVMFKRRVENDTVREAAAILMMYLLLFAGSAMVISRVEHVTLLAAMFETGSAVGTVGLTLGLTPKLGALSHLILIVLMYFGRVGGLTVIYAAVKKAGHGARFPRETLTVG